MSRASNQRQTHLGQGAANHDPTKTHSAYDGGQNSQQQQYNVNLSPSTMYPQNGYYLPAMYHQQQEYYAEPGWQSNGYAPSEGGPSRSSLPSLPRELYAGYHPAQTQRSSSSEHPTPPTPLQWTSVGGEPVSSSAYPNRRMSPSIPVKLEDLVSQDRDTSGRGGSSNGPGGFSSMPLPPSTTGPQNARAGPSKAAGKAGTGDTSGTAAPSDFIKKLYKMLEEEWDMYGQGLPAVHSRGPHAQRGSVGWAKGGLSFVVWDMNDFSTKILPQTFRHSNFSSFVRQLNKYGFSKIKHTDETDGIVKENVWEFQHPNFQAGGTSDLESIKRKAAVSKKVDVETEVTATDRAPAPASAQQTTRLAEMQARVQGLEDQLASALEEVRQVKIREQGTAGLLREILSNMTKTDRAANSQSASPSDIEPSSQIGNMWQIYENLVSCFPTDVQPSLGISIPRTSNYPRTMQDRMRNSNSNSTTGPSPRTDGSRQSQDSAIFEPTIDDTDMGDLTSTGRIGGTTDLASIPGRAMYPPDGLNPVYADTPAWLTKGVTVPMPMYHRKSSDGMAYQVMMGALGTQGTRHDEGHDPLQPRIQGSQQQLGEAHLQPRPSTSSGPIPAPTSSRTAPIVQSSPFGTLLIPADSIVHPASAVKPKSESSGKSKAASQKSPPEIGGKAIRRASVIQPHWNRTPRVLVVEDDMVYRQLSKKFLEKFGCVVEIVENAHEAIEMINRTKYDLVLMDIFFGPSMDGRKATSLIRQFDRYTPIISMTSNAQPQDISSYLQSGMNDILAKPFTKHGLFGILDKHLLHMKVLQLSAEVPRSVGVPPLSDQGVQEAVAQGAAVASGLLNWGNDEVRNPLAAMGWSDDTYQIVLDQFLRTGNMPDVSSFNFLTGQPMSAGNQAGNGFAINGEAELSVGGTVGPSAIFGDFNSRKRSLEMGNGMWSAASGTSSSDVASTQQQQNGGASKSEKRAKR